MKNIVLFILRFAPVFIWSHSGGFLEYTSEVLRILETELIGYLRLRSVSRWAIPFVRHCLP